MEQARSNNPKSLAYLKKMDLRMREVDELVVLSYLRAPQCDGCRPIRPIKLKMAQRQTHALPRDFNCAVATDVATTERPHTNVSFARIL